MITLLESFDFIFPSEYRFSPPKDALMNVLNTPSLQPSTDSVYSEDFLANNSRANNGFAPEEYSLNHFNID